MKRLIALGIALMVLLFGFATTANVAVAENEVIQVCSDLDPKPNPHDIQYEF